MYSVVLMMVLAASDQAPTGILRGAGCNGAEARQGVLSGMKERRAERKDRRQERRDSRRSGYGCNGGNTGVASYGYSGGHAQSYRLGVFAHRSSSGAKVVPYHRGTVIVAPPQPLKDPCLECDKAAIDRKKE